MAFANLSLRAHNPLFAREKGRNIIMLGFDDSLDSSKDLECFFVMPEAVRAIRRARVWVDRKAYRAYETGASSGGGSTSGNGGGGTSASGGTHSHQVTVGDIIGGRTTGSTSGHTHSYDDSTASTVTGTAIDHTHTTDVHSHSTPAHTHDLTYAISETGPSGNVALFVANDGTNYGSAITSGVTSISDQDITSQLTRSSGSKRLKITATGLMRVQVLLLLDLSVAVFS